MPQTGLVASSTYIGYFFGAFLSGVLADVIGRRRIMMSALAIYCAASLASAAATDWHTFFALRIVAGFGSGAETVVIAPFLAEFVPRRYRGIFCGALVGFMSFGYLGSSILGFTVVRNFADGWRYLAVVDLIAGRDAAVVAQHAARVAALDGKPGAARRSDRIVSDIEAWFAQAAASRWRPSLRSWRIPASAAMNSGALAATC